MTKRVTIKFHVLKELPSDFFDSLEEFGWDPREIFTNDQGQIVITTDANENFVKEFFKRYYKKLKPKIIIEEEEVTNENTTQ